MDRPEPRPEERLALIELLDRDGRARRTLDVHAWPVTLGRALDNTWVLDDAHVAAHHATLQLDQDGRLQLQVGDSLNGIDLDQRHLRAGQGTTLPAGGALLQLGGQRLRLRLAGAPIAPESPLARPLAHGAMLWALALAWVLVQAAQRWVALDPGADLVQWLPWLLGLPGGLALWCGSWALASKLFRHGFEFASHAAIALVALLAFEALELLLPLAAAALDLPLLWQAWRQWGPPLLAALLVRAHLRQLLPQRGRAIDVSVAAMLLAGIAVSAAVNLRQQGQVFSAPYMHTLPPPALRWGGGQPVPSIDAAMRRLRDEALQRAAKAAAEDADEGDEPP
ncbi:MAG: hypothetical protein A3E25_05015 [Burkholderiales bacterium RIFCSPHIGHO2_12_FULL_69_20]|nr:MAG: hypothetical protein A3E25_05015 [Burkholderiales bacterium RIFCSPHIGHO2_12_FULL_69_20]